MFADAPSFRPLYTPAECLREGIFGGCYFNSRGGKLGVFGRDVAVSHEEFPAEWFEVRALLRAAAPRASPERTPLSISAWLCIVTRIATHSDLQGLPESRYISRRYNIKTNKHGVKAGQDQAFWEQKGWIHAQAVARRIGVPLASSYEPWLTR